jgi:predicted O-linked N-acetylglucosamine transferase (SPINDLY family)
LSARSQTGKPGTETVVHINAVEPPSSDQLAGELNRVRASLTRGEIQNAVVQLVCLQSDYPGREEVSELLGSAHLLALRSSDAIRVAGAALREHPDSLPLHRLMYRAAVEARDGALAERSLLEIARLAPADGKCLEQLADLQRYDGRVEHAIANYRSALERDRSLLGAYQNLSGCLIQCSRFEEAIEVCQSGLQRFKRLPELHYNLGLACDRLGRFEAAAAAYYAAIERNPGYVKALSNLGNTLHALGRLDEAEARVRSALREDAGLFAAHVNLGNILKAQGRLEQSYQSYQQAAQIAPNNPVSWSNLVALLPYLSQCDHVDEASIVRRFDATMSAQSNEAKVPAARTRPTRSGRLRIGYVSADFRDHVGMYFVEPVLEHHDRARFEIFCYDNTTVADQVSARLRALDCTWRSIGSATDEQVVELIRADGIDILIDRMGHTIGHRLGVFARRAAPVQMTWQAFPGSTGLAAMDYWVTDRYVAHGDCIQDYRTESFLALPNCDRCFRPDADSPDVQAAPFARTGNVTFGSFSAAYKLNDALLGVWTELLHLVPGSRLLIVSIPDGIAQQRILRYFRAHGIADDRVRIMSRVPLQDYLKLHGEIDVMLDPFPYNGVTTTLQSLWMGVPVLTMKGARYPARVGASILANVGLHSLIAHSETEYIEKACQLAADPARLDRLRSTMRTRMLASPLMDAETFTRDFEALLLGVATRKPGGSAILADDGWLKLY